MDYCTSYDLIDRFGATELIQRTDRTNAGVIDDTVLDRAISDASSEINAYLAGFTLPSTSTVLVGIACDIARYRLYDDQIMYSDLGKPISQVAIRYERWILYLKDVAAGKIKLSPDANGAVAESSNLPQMTVGVRVFER
jgi:phage gp36-like protein